MKKRDYGSVLLVVIIFIFFIIISFIFLFSYGPVKDKGILYELKDVFMFKWLFHDLSGFEGCGSVSFSSPLSIIPRVQDYEMVSCSPVIVDSSWKIYANLNEEYDNFTAYYLQNKILVNTSILLGVGDITSMGSGKRIVIGEISNPAIAAIASADGIDYNNEITKGFGQGYVLYIGNNEILILGNTTAGTFYGAVSLIWLLNKNGANIILPNTKIDDWPDLKVRGLYYNGHGLLKYGDGTVLDMYTDSDVLAMYKLNLDPSSMINDYKFYKHRHVFLEGYVGSFYLGGSLLDNNPDYYEGVYFQNLSFRFNDYGQAEYVSPPQIIINNPGFENGVQPDGKSPVDWIAGSNGNGYWNLDCNQGYSGSCSLHLNLLSNLVGENPSPGFISGDSSGGYFYRVKPNTVYQVSAWIKVSASNNLKVGAGGFDLDLEPESKTYDGHYGWITWNNNSNGNWQYYHNLFTTNGSEIYMYLHGRVKYADALQVWIDDINVSEVQTSFTNTSEIGASITDIGPLVNVIQTSDTDIRVWNQDRSILYKKDVDYTETNSGNLNKDYSNGRKTVITRLNSGGIPNNANISVDYDALTSDSNIVSINDPGALILFNKSISSNFKVVPDFVFLPYDEYYGINRDSRFLKTGYRGYKAFAYFLNSLTDIIHSYNQDTIVYTWADDIINPYMYGQGQHGLFYPNDFKGKFWHALDLISKNLYLSPYGYGTGNLAIAETPLIYKTYGINYLPMPDDIGSLKAWTYTANKYPMLGTVFIYFNYVNMSDNSNDPADASSFSRFLSVANYSWNGVKDPSIESQMGFCQNNPSGYNLNNDTFNCGSCGNVCYAPHSYYSCVNGQCNFDGCYEDYSNLGNNVCGIPQSCGNGVCEDWENCSTCTVDCGDCSKIIGQTLKEANAAMQIQNNSNINQSKKTLFKKRSENEKNDSLSIELPKKVNKKNIKQSTSPAQNIISVYWIFVSLLALGCILVLITLIRAINKKNKKNVQTRFVSS